MQLRFDALKLVLSFKYQVFRLTRISILDLTRVVATNDFKKDGLQI